MYAYTPEHIHIRVNTIYPYVTTFNNIMSVVNQSCKVELENLHENQFAI